MIKKRPFKFTAKHFEVEESCSAKDIARRANELMNPHLDKLQLQADNLSSVVTKMWLLGEKCRHLLFNSNPSRITRKK